MPLIEYSSLIESYTLKPGHQKKTRAQEQILQVLEAFPVK
jgi:hypothetical protein